MEWETGLDFDQIRAAAQLARHGTLSNPTKPGNWLVLSHALAKLGKFDDALACLREAIEILPEAVELHIRLVEVLQSQDRFDEALPHVEKTLALAPGDPRATRLYLDVLALMGAEQKLDNDLVATFSAKSARLLSHRIKSLGLKGAVALCDSLLAEKPGHTHATYLKALALSQLGRAEDARRLISVDRAIEMQEPPPPPGYSTARSFRDALAQEIQANPTVDGDRKGKAARDCLQTRSLRLPGAVAVEALLRQIRQAVDVYEERLVASGDEFALSRPQRARLEPWAMICGGAGRQNPHVHPSGWVSGVYYVAAPRPDGANAYRGPLVMGAIDARKRGVVPPWGTREIEPVPGRLILFPSYVPHETLPSGVDGDRIAVAFDVVDASI